jgi:alkylated DNA nucleotide flippase Atl1
MRKYKKEEVVLLLFHYPYKSMHPHQAQLYHLIETLPEGKITTYARLAQKLGNRHLARCVGKWLSVYPHFETGNCYRVVHSDGRVGGYCGSDALDAQTQKRTKLELLGCVFNHQGKIINFDDMVVSVIE